MFPIKIAVEKNGGIVYEPAILNRNNFVLVLPTRTPAHPVDPSELTYKLKCIGKRPPGVWSALKRREDAHLFDCPLELYMDGKGKPRSSQIIECKDHKTRYAGKSWVDFKLTPPHIINSEILTMDELIQKQMRVRVEYLGNLSSPPAETS